MHHSAVTRRGLALTTAAALAASMAVGVVWSPRANAATGGTELYAVATTDDIGDEDLTDQSLYSIDVSDGSATKVVDLQIDGVRGMDFSPLDNELYVHFHDGAVCPGPGVSTLDMTDGSATPVVPTDLKVPDAAFGPDGTFYVWDDEGNCRDDDATGSDDLWAVDLEAGTVTELGQSGISGYQTGVAVAPDGTLWVNTGGEFFTIDPDTGAGTLEFTADVGDVLDNSIAFGPDGTLYGIDRAGTSTTLHTIDTTDGTTTLVGDMGIEKVVAIAFRDAEPVANDDVAEVGAATTVDIDVTANDTDAEDDELTPSIVDAPMHGTAEVNPDGTVAYTHHGSLPVSDTFTYEVSDGVNTSNTATVTVGPAGLSVVALGGELVVSTDVVADVDAIIGGGPTMRYAGDDRYDTAVTISEKTFPDGADVAYVANASTDDKFPDALAGGPSAATKNGPVLLISQDTVPGVVKAELDRLDPTNIVVLGGELAVSADVEDVLADHTDGEVFRWGGADRFETAAIVSQRTYDPGVDAVWIATGRNFADALAAGTAAFQAGGPVLLVEQDSVPSSVADELDRLMPANIYVAGGPVAVSDDVVTALGGHTDGAVTRVSGDTRYDTAAEISDMVFDGSTVAFLATGLKFPDALAGVVAAALLDAPILLTDTTLPEATSDELARLDGEA